MSKMVISYNFKPENLFGRQGLVLMKRYATLLSCVDKSELEQSIKVDEFMSKLAELHKILNSNIESKVEPEQFREQLADFCEFMRLHFGKDVSYTNKFHILEHHIGQLVETYGSLGPYSEKSSKRMHSITDERMAKFRIEIMLRQIRNLSKNSWNMR